ncbi:hypothetical protein LTR27_011764 [Elasticomyces elasticus]|nr:hypothetical protein LTR27_011764 [Elasticomyces elasticus]
MGRIFRQAERVYVWLGETGGAVDEPKVSMSSGLCVSHSMGDFISQADVVNFLSLKEKVWWRRLWVMQEVAVGREVVVCLGPRTSGWEQFVKCMTDSMKEEATAVRDLRATRAMHERLKQLDRVRDTIRTELVLPLNLALELSVGAYTSEPLDKIIGLLGLTSALVPTSYTMGPGAIFASACLEVIEQTRSLDILVGQWSRRWFEKPHNRYLPSWIPDFAGPVRNHSSSTSGPFVNNELKHAQLRAWLGWTSGAIKPPSVRSSISWHALQLQGLLVDRTQSDTLHHITNVLSPFVSHIATVKQRRTFWETLPMGFMDRSMNGVFHRPKDYGVTTVTMPTPQEVAAVMSGVHLTGHHFTKDLDSVLEELLQWQSSRGSMSLESSLSTPGSPRYDNEPSRDASRWLEVVSDMLLHRVLFRTETGYVGVANPGVQVGDIAIVAFGASVPFLLRQALDRSYDLKRYRLVDGCIIHGVMNGELLSAYQAGEVQSESYEIV